MKPKREYQRSSGVLLPITTLHGPYGIGVIGPEAMKFIDFLCKAGFHAWQVLPVEHTGQSFSPYKCISAFAGDPMLIDPRMLREMGLVTTKELSARARSMSADYVKFELVRKKQYRLLRVAYSRLGGKPYAEFNPPWLDNYALYMALKHRYDGKPWYEWPDDDVRSHDTKAIRRARDDLAVEINFHRFVQWLFDIQWRKLKKYAADHNITIVGDLPIYVSEDSAEVWSRRKLFNADADGNFLAVGGAPPDYFTPDGQLWGNPIYNWGLMKRGGYKWWIDRIKSAIERYDIIRLDHFRGFEGYWSIPAQARTAREGKWVKGPGIRLFKAMEEALGKLPVIAEDLGDITDDVIELLRETGFRGMRVMQFGFMGEDLHLPHNFDEKCVAYTGTHDNTTLLAWMFELNPKDRKKALLYTGFEGDWTIGGPNCALIKTWTRTLFMSGASLTIVPIQDLLGYGSDTRTNIPGTPEGNWKFRMRSGALDQIDAKFYASLNKAYDRDNPAVPET